VKVAPAERRSGGPGCCCQRPDIPPRSNAYATVIPWNSREIASIGPVEVKVEDHGGAADG
jgi:hypothetical protein